MLKLCWKAACLLLIGLMLVSCSPEERPQPSSGRDSLQTAQDQQPGPPSGTPQIDGKLLDGEWQEAETWDLEDGGQLYILSSESHLYLALQAAPGGMIVGNVFLFDGEVIRVFHSSAALGTAVYQPEGDAWQRIKEFAWCCREKVDDQDARQARLAFYDREGWLGANSFLGAENELEYEIQLPGPVAALAVNYLRADGSGQKQVWPAGLADGVSWPAEDGFPEVMEFSPRDWYGLDRNQ